MVLVKITLSVVPFMDSREEAPSVSGLAIPFFLLSNGRFLPLSSQQKTVKWIGVTSLSIYMYIRIR